MPDATMFFGVDPTWRFKMMELDSATATREDAAEDC